MIPTRPPTEPPTDVPFAAAVPSIVPGGVVPGAQQPTTGAIIGRTVAALACAIGAALGSGIVGAVLTFAAVSSNDDPRTWDGLGSLIIGFLAFLVISTIVYIVAATVCLTRFVPAGHRLFPMLFLMSPVTLCLMAFIVANV